MKTHYSNLAGQLLLLLRSHAAARSEKNGHVLGGWEVEACACTCVNLWSVRCGEAIRIVLSSLCAYEEKQCVLRIFMLVAVAFCVTTTSSGRLDLYQFNVS